VNEVTVSEHTPSYETTLHELLEALAESAAGAERGRVGEAEARSGCAICRLVARSRERALRALFAEFVNDPKTREAWRRARGFCSEHTPLIASLGDALAVAILYHDLADQTRERWLSIQSRRGPRSFGGRRRSAASPAPCPACAATREAEQRYTRALAAGLEQPAVWKALEANSGLCVGHTEQILAASSPAIAGRLRQQEADRLAALQAELAEIVRKNDYRFRGESWGPERDAWLRALRKITRPEP
jgi:hypothetical protein